MVRALGLVPQAASLRDQPKGCPISSRYAPYVERSHPSSATREVIASQWYGNGTGAGVRTQDRRFRKPMLYPTELRPHTKTDQFACEKVTSKKIYKATATFSEGRKGANLEYRIYPQL